MKKSKAWLILLPIAGWLWFLAFPLVFLNAGNNSDRVLKILADLFYWQFILCYFVIFYLNSRVLVPKLFLKKKHTAYGIIILFLFIGICIYQPFDRLLSNNQTEQPWREGGPPAFRPGPPGFGPGADAGNPYPGPPPQDLNRRHEAGSMPPGRPGPHGPDRKNQVDVVSIFIFIMIIALSTAVKMARQWLLTERRAAIAEAGRANAELSFLKAQINPHFLFNTLNNIYTLALAGSKYTADSIMKLSNIMRYVTDEVTADFVLLDYEIECIESYIDLQRLRVGKKTEISFSVNGNSAGKVIPPLVLMTFVENVFKYGISKTHQSKLVIDVTVTETQIKLFCENPVHQSHAGEREGVGIKNTRQRLQYLYPNKHTLKIDALPGVFAVQLTILT